METATQTLHRLTSYAAYDPDTVWDPPVDDPRVVSDLVVNDVERLPWFFKRYSQPLPRVALPRELPRTTAPALSALTGAPVPPGRLDVPQLARLLFLSSGVVRTTVQPYATWLFRAAGSAGARFPLELYVAMPEGMSAPAGVHWYDPLAHELLLVGPPPRGGVPAVVVTGVPWRTGWRYRERGYRHVYWDAGTMLAQLLALAASAGLASALYTRFPDAAVAALVGADGVNEWPVAVVALADGEPALDAPDRAVAGEVDPAPLEFPLVTAAQRAGEQETLGPPWDRGLPVDMDVSGGGALDDVILRRSSQRRMDPARSIPKSVLVNAMSVAMRGIDVPHRVVVHHVEGLAPGVYHWPDLSAPARPGALRDDLYRVCMDQGLPRDAAFVVISATDVATLDDRDYREAQLAAGVVEGRLHLAAYAQEASASGMTFVDAEIPELLGEPLDGLLCTCVGVPDNTSKPGGPPGAPVEIRMVTPRTDDD